MPLIALQYHEVKINLEFEDKANLTAAGTLNGDISSASLWVDYIFLDTDERRRFAQLSHEYLITQLQFTGDEALVSGNNRIKLNFNHPVQELVWVGIPSSGVNSNQWTTYTSGGANMTTSAKLQLNGHDRFAERAGEYFNLVQPFQHHENVPGNKGINVYSFALQPEQHQPSGTLNMSRIDTAVLSLTAAAAGKVKVFATNYNVLRIMSGINNHLCPTVSCQCGYYATTLGKQCKHSHRYNWLVGYCINNLQQTQIVGKLLRVLATTRRWQQWMRTSGNDRRYSNNAKNWTIRSQASAIRMTMDRMKVQRADGFGDERLVNLLDSLRCAPAKNKSFWVTYSPYYSGKGIPSSGVAWLTATKRFTLRCVTIINKNNKNKFIFQLDKRRCLVMLVQMC